MTRNSTTPDLFQTRIINGLNADCARRRRGILLWVTKPQSHGNACFAQFDWTEEQYKLYLEVGSLPCDLYTIDPETTMVALWILAVKGTSGSRVLPEFELPVMPDFKKQHALCIVDMGTDDEGKQRVALTPSDCLEMVLSPRRSVLYRLKDNRVIDQFTTTADFESLAALEARILKGAI